MRSWTNVLTQILNDNDSFSFLGGPMSGFPQYNFPLFEKVTLGLRAKGERIVTLPEWVTLGEAAKALASKDGQGAVDWSFYAGLGCALIASPQCKGGIYLPHWDRSTGSRVERAVLDGLGKPFWPLHQEWLEEITSSRDRPSSSA